MPPTPDSDYWAMAKLGDLLAEHVATPTGTIDLDVRRTRAAELQAIESHLLRRLIEAQVGALLTAAATLKNE